VSVASNSLLIVLKLVVGLLIGSVAVISEAVHSAMDLAAVLVFAAAAWIIHEAARKLINPHEIDMPFWGVGGGADLGDSQLARVAPAVQGG